MNGPYPTPEDHSDETGRRLEVQTDKKQWKIVPCTYEGCDVDLVVNVFYAPHKGKCAEHGTKSPKAIATSRLVVGGVDAEPNGALAKLLCPICGLPLLIVNMSNDAGFITFRCADGSFSDMKELHDRQRKGGKLACGTSVQIRPNWASMEINGIPTRFSEMAREFNIQQQLAYFDERDRRNENNS